MDIFVARQARLGFGTIATLVNTSPINFIRCNTKPILDELETLVTEQEQKGKQEVVISTCLRINLEQIKLRLNQNCALSEEDKNAIVLFCQNVVDAFMAIG